MKRVLLFPYLAGLYPVLFIYANNWGTEPASDMLVPLGLAVLLSTCFIAIGWLVTRDWVKASLSSVVGTSIFCSFTLLKNLLDLDAQKFGMLAILVWFGCAFILRKIQIDFGKAKPVLNLLSLLLVAFPLIQIASGASRRLVAFLPVDIPVTHPPHSEKPDILYVILDGYGRADQIKRVMGFDNSQFVSELQQLGFVVPSESNANYCQTELSLSSTLNLSYLQKFSNILKTDSQDRQPLDNAINNSFIAAYLKKAGYVTVGIASGFPRITFGSTDATYTGKKTLSLVQSALIQMTPLASTGVGITSAFVTRRDNLNAAFENLQIIEKPTPRPRFLVAHILAPHPPFVFDSEGRPVRQSSTFSYADGSDYMSLGGTPQGYMDGYVGQTQYINKKILQILRRIILNSAIKPIIIIAGDHGSKLGLDQASLEKTDLKECFGNLQAFYGPKEFLATISDDSTPVNFFRKLLRSVFHEDVQDLPNRNYYSPFPRPYKFTEVTDSVNK